MSFAASPDTAVIVPRKDPARTRGGDEVQLLL